ncbi:MAG: CPBP family intramembrane metalloprotease [Bacteroidales bacterium]|nr:CPBP family intramembrane metalloprotease [Bacteroidales bacterium]
MKNAFAHIHPFSKFIISLIIIVLSFLIVFFIGLIIAIPTFDLNIFELQSTMSNYSDPNSIRLLKYMQTIQSFGIFIIPAFIIAFIFSKQPNEYLCLNKKRHYSLFILTTFILICSIPLINCFGVLNIRMDLPDWLSSIEIWMQNQENRAKLLTEAFLTMPNIGSLFFNLFMIAVLPAIGEELIFRGIFQKLFIEWTKSIYWGIILSAFLFSFIHFQFYGFLPRFMLGLLFGYLFYRSGSIWIPILAHFVNNSLAVLSSYSTPDLESKVENLSLLNPGLIITTIIASLICYVLLVRFYKKTRKS